MKLLVIASGPITASDLEEAVGEDATEEAEVLVVAQDSPLRFWLSDADSAIAEAERVQRESVEELTEAGVDASGDTGEGDPLEAVQDALQTFRADRIVVFTHPEGDQAYLEGVDPAEIEERFGIQTTLRTISG
jgi:nucleotide-binding universal stress UspA family protein